MPAVGDDLTANYYVVQASFNSVDESSFRLDPDEKLKLHEQDPINLNYTLTSPRTIIEKPTKSYVDSSHENSRNRQKLSSKINDQDKDFDLKKLTSLDSITDNRNPS